MMLCRMGCVIKTNDMFGGRVTSLFLRGTHDHVVQYVCTSLFIQDTRLIWVLFLARHGTV